MRRLCASISLHQHSQNTALGTVGYPGFGSINHVVIILTDSLGSDSLQISSAVGLGQSDSTTQFAGCKSGEIVRFLARGAKPLNGSSHNKVGVDYS